MRRSFPSPLASRVSLFCVLAASAAVLVPQVAAQKQPVLLPGVIVTPPDQKRTDNGLFTIPEQRDARQQLQAVMDYLGRTNVPWDVVTGTAQQLLDAKSDSFYRVKDAKGNDTGAVVSVKSKVNQLLADMPKEGRQFYEQEFGPRATEQLKKAVEAGYDRPALADLSQRLYHTKAGAQATLLLAGVDLESGQYTEAAYGFQRLMARPDAAEVLTPRVLLKAAMAFRRSGDARQGEAVAALWQQLEKTFPREGLAVGRKTYTVEELRAELDRPIDLGGSRATDRFVSARLGNASHTGTGDGGTPFLDPLFTKPLLFRREGIARQGAEWVAQSLEAAFKRTDPAKREVHLPGFFPVTANGMVVYRAYDGVYAVASQDGLMWQGKPRAAGELLWIAEAEGGAQSIMSAEDSGVPLTAWNQFWGPRSPAVLFENALLGSLSHDGRLAYYVDDLAVPPQPPVNNPNMGIPQPAPGAASSTKLGAKQNYNRLTAVNLDTGKLVWTLGGPEGAPLKDDEEEKTTDTQLLTENVFFLGPPLAVNGRLYVLYERKSQVKLACLDPARILVGLPPADGKTPPHRYPELLWTQTLGDASTSLRTDTLRRVQPAYLAYSDGVLVCPTNCGVVVGVDVSARRLLWARYYGSPTDPKTLPGGGGGFPPGVVFGGGMRGGMPVAQPIPTDRWRAATPIVTAGKVLVTAHDSDQLQCLDLRTGESLWATPREQDDLYVAGVAGDNVLVVGKSSVRALKVEAKGSPAAAWERFKIGTPCGHGVMGRDGVYYLPMLGGPDKADARVPQVWAVDTAAGTVKSRTAFRRKVESGADPRQVLGNLLFQDGQLFSQSAVELTSFPLIELKRREMAERLKANPKDPEGLFARGELSLDNGDTREAIADFKAAEANGPSDALRKKMRQKFYIAYTELLRTKFEDGEPYLAEYEALCELPIDAEDPAERQRQLDEQLRRKALYLTILARGREKQGRLGDAYDAYRAFASLGDNRQLVTIHDEPNAQTRPDVWARGRIDAMLRGAADPAARKPLDDRVAKEWDGLRAGNDLPRLREFVRVFGAFSAAGQEAQLLLSERLLATRNDDDQREAQSLLMQLWAAAEAPGVAARAVERLGSLLAKRGQPEDAVGMYAQLGTRYAGVAVRDGKTGADLFAELATDKRLLPYLDPGRVAAMAGYKVEAVNAAVARPAGQGFALRPTGELFPFYRRFQMTLEANPAGDGTWVLRVADRNTGEERCKFPGLSPINQGAMVNRFDGQPTNFANSKLAQANGQLLLVTLGQFAYCFDLAEKRELWRQNLLGKSPTASAVQPTIEPDGEITFQYDDGWTFRMARSAVLQQTYVALVTRDGLKAVDPATGQELWVRNNLSPKVQIFGDERHVFVIDGGVTKVLRAIDGTAVEGVKDFAARVAKTGATTFLGRMILTTEVKEGTRVFSLYDPLAGADVWRREFPGRPAVLRTTDPEVAGVLSATGRFEAFDVRTGKDVSAGQVDPAQVPAVVASAPGSMLATDPLLLLDAERSYLVLGRGRDANVQSRVYFGGAQAMLRTLPANGAVYAFDRATGQRLWYNHDALVGQQLILDRFEELPVLVAATQVVDMATRLQTYRVTVLDKRTGRLVHNYPHNLNGGEFAQASRDPKTRAVEFWRFNDNLRLRVTPDE